MVKGKSVAAVVIDLANINGGFEVIKRSNSEIDSRARLDFGKLVNAITLGSEVFEKSVYFETRKTAAQDGQRKFQDYLKHEGFRIITKELKTINLGNGGTMNKANFDVEIATDVCRYAWRRDCNEVIIVSGDSDFAYLIDMLKDLDIKVTIVSSNATISRELRDRADRPILLDDLNIKDIIFIKE